MILGGFALELSAQIPISAQEDKSTTENFYKSFSGMLAGEAIRLNLRFVDGELSGKYINQDKTISLEMLTPKQAGKAWVLFEKEEGETLIDEGYTWKFRITKENINGIGFVEKNNRTYPIHLTEDYPEGVSRFSIHSYHKTVSIFPDDPESSEFNIVLIFPKVESPSIAEDFVNRKIKKTLGFDERMSFQAGVEKVLKEYEKDYKQAVVEFEEEAEGIVSDWQFTRDINIEFNEGGYVLLADNTREYSGGAHGLTNENYWAFDMQNQKLLILKDLTTIDYAELRNLLETQFRKGFDLIAEDSLDKILFENQLKPAKNFRFDKQGIYFVYNPYEAGPYSLQNFEVFISYQELKGTLVPEFAKRMGLSTEEIIN